MGKNFFGKDFNPNSGDVNLLGDDDEPFGRTQFCTAMNVQCERVSKCLQWSRANQGTVDCHMENLISNELDPLEQLIQKEEIIPVVSFTNVVLNAVPERGEEVDPRVFEVMRIETVEHFDEVFKDLEDTPEFSGVPDLKVFELPKRERMSKSIARQGA